MSAKSSYKKNLALACIFRQRPCSGPFKLKLNHSMPFLSLFYRLLCFLWKRKKNRQSNSWELTHTYLVLDSCQVSLDWSRGSSFTIR